MEKETNWKLASDGWWPADDEEQEERTGDHHRRRFHDDCLFYLFILEFSPFNKWGFGVNKQIIHCEYQLMSTLCMENHEVAQCRRRTLILSRDSGGIKKEREREKESCVKKEASVGARCLALTERRRRLVSAVGPSLNSGALPFGRDSSPSICAGRPKGATLVRAH